MATGGIVYLKIDRSRAPEARVSTVPGGRVPSVYRGNAVTFRVGVFDGATAPADLGNMANLTLAYMPATRADAALAAETSAIVDATFGEAEFLAGEKWHAEISFSETDMNPTLAALAEAFWLVAYSVASPGGEEVTHGGGPIVVIEDGTQNAVDPPPGPETGVTSTQVATQIEAALAEADPLANPMASAGSLIVGGEGGEPAELAYLEDGKILGGVDGAPAWVDPPDGGGMANPMTTAGDLIVGGEGGAPGRLGKGANHMSPRMDGGGIVWRYPHLYSERLYYGSGGPISAETLWVGRWATNANLRRWEVAVDTAPEVIAQIRLRRNGSVVTGSTINLDWLTGGITFATSVTIVMGDLLEVEILNTGEYMGSGAAVGPMQVGFEWHRESM